MKKEIKVIIDTDEARRGLFLHGNFAALHKDSDEEIVNKAIEHVGEFASKFGFELAPKKPILNANVEKTMTVKINTQIARRMLGVAGYNVAEKTDDEIVELALGVNSIYGVDYKCESD